jgi:hypothetical protein
VYEGSMADKLATDYGDDAVRAGTGSMTVNGISAPAKIQRRLSAGEPTPSVMQERLRGFALLAPPIGVGPEALRDVNQLIFDSAARLMFALTSLSGHLEKRLARVLGLQGSEAIKDHSKDCELWYVSNGELEHMFIMSGVNWMTRNQLKRTFTMMDLNGSGRLHMSEITEVVKTTTLDCLDILKNKMTPFEVRKYLLRIPGEPVGGSLRQQLLAQFQTEES